MAIKKSELYSSLWASCDELRGGMDASQYKDYVLFMLFIKYVSDKYGNSDDFAPPITIPKGASFQDMVALKGNPEIGDRINTQIIQPLVDANAMLARTDFPDFNDPNKLGEGDEKVKRLENLIAIFQKPELDFSNNRAEQLCSLQGGGSPESRFLDSHRTATVFLCDHSDAESQEGIR